MVDVDGSGDYLSSSNKLFSVPLINFLGTVDCSLFLVPSLEQLLLEQILFIRESHALSSS